MKSSRFLCLFVLAAVFVADRSIKVWVVRHWDEGAGFPIVDGWLRLTRVDNTGAAFGLWRGAGQALAVFSALSAVLIVVYLLGFFKRPVSHAFAWALVAGGALGNLYDRAAFGHVIDYIDLRVWPVFNLADACICTGVLWVVLCFVLEHRRKPG